MPEENTQTLNVEKRLGFGGKMQTREEFVREWLSFDGNEVIAGLLRVRAVRCDCDYVDQPHWRVATDILTEDGRIMVKGA